MLKFFHKILKDLKQSKKQTVKLFFTLVDHLEKINISLTAAAMAIGVKTSTAHSWKQRGSGAKQEHIDALIAAFPQQLTDKAVELGIMLPDPSEKPETVLPIIEELLNTVNRLKEEVEQAQELKKEKAKLLKEIEVLKSRLKEKAP